MNYPIQVITRDKLCIVSKEMINLCFVSWALSKGFHAIYIENNHQLIGYINLSKRINKFSKYLLELSTLSNAIDYIQYINATDKNTLFPDATTPFLPIIKDHQIYGELIHIIPSLPFAHLYWDLISDDIYIRFFNTTKIKILFTTLDSRTHYLYTKLQQLNFSNLNLYSPDSKTSTLSHNIIIFHASRHEIKSFKDNTTSYLSLDYIYRQLLILSVFDFYKKNNISFYYVQLPSSLDDIPTVTKDNIYSGKLLKFALDKAALDKYYGDNYNKHFFENGDYKKVSVIDIGLKHCLKDCTSDTYNVIHNRRVTVNAPLNYTNSIHCFGPCIVRGGYVCDDSTICSYLQENINKLKSNWINVINYGVEGNTIYDLHNMMSASYKPNDIILFFGATPPSYFLNQGIKINIIDTLPVYKLENPDHPSIINSVMHITHHMNKLLANHIFKHLQPSLNSSNIAYKQDIKMNLPYTPSLSTELDSFKKMLTKYRIDNYANKKIGAIIMNCNPFTLGHLYLVQQSLKYVDHLYVFIVEEDKSFFSFSDRYQLAQSCCKHLKNVTVLPSGAFIISTLTFPEYFFKDQLQNVSIDPSKDIEMFGHEIAPILNITYRFLGEEPLDKITAQYNAFLKEQLRWYNIQVIEIPRKSINNKVISASLVRNFIKQNDIENTKDLLPTITYNFILNKFKK